MHKISPACDVSTLNVHVLFLYPFLIPVPSTVTLEASDTNGWNDANLLIELVFVTVSTTTEACSWKPLGLP